VTAVVFAALLMTGAVVFWYGHRLRRLADARVAEMIGPAEVEAPREEPRRRIASFPARHPLAAPGT
jgi:hypothetical protein